MSGNCARKHTTTTGVDGVVGCAVAASIEGAVLPGTQEVAAPKRERIKLSDLRRQSRV